SEQALQRLQCIPIPFVRRRIAQRVEAYARAQGRREITAQVYEMSKGVSLSQCVSPAGGTERADGAPGDAGRGSVRPEGT
ncbi:MAG: PCP reductase family protein, partial [Nitrospinae bacterium]|nr:PCP reductase family protein [Nitrospinota bacterium]